MKFSAIFKRRKLQFRFPITVDKIEKFCNSKAWYMKGNYQKQRQLKLTQKTYEKIYNWSSAQFGRNAVQARTAKEHLNS